MMSIRNDILTEQQLRRLNEHKYSASGDTLLDPYMQKFWKWSVQQFPTWVAPNLMTVLGLIVNALTTLILIYYSPDAKAAVPAWALLLFALGLFVYQTLDACDGKQARRTNSSSTLGELFDHGCDSLSTVFVAISACVAVQLGEYPNLMFYQCIAASALFYAAHWQTYVSAKLRFGKFDVTEAQFCIIAIHLVSTIFGVEVWSKQVPFVNCSFKILIICMIFLGEVNQFLYYFKIIFAGGVGKNGSTVAINGLNCDLKIIPIFISVLSHITMLFNNLTVIFGGGVGKNGSTVAGTSVLSPCIPIAIVISSAVIIYKKSTTDLVQLNPCLYLLTFGIIIAKITNKLVIAHMTKSEMQYLDSSFIGPFLLFLNQYFNTFLNEKFVLWLALIYSIIDIILYASSLCLQISSFLGIYIFSLKKRPPGKQDNRFKTVNDANHEVDTDIERRSLLEANGDSSEEESDSNNDRNTEGNRRSSAGEQTNDDELKEVRVLDEALVKAGNEDGEQQLNQLGVKLQSESLPFVKHENMIQFDSEMTDGKLGEELNERSTRKDFLSIDLGDNEFSRSYTEQYTDGLVNGVSSSLKNSELLNKLNISNISDILNASNASNNSFQPNKSSPAGNEESNSSDNSDEIEIFTRTDLNKNQLESASHNRTI